MFRPGERTTSDNVVDLSEKRRAELSPALAQIEAYWQTMRRGRIVPARSDIDPRGLQGVLEHAFILERVSIGLARFRLAGSHLNDFVGMEVRGMPLSAIFEPDARETLSETVEATFDAPAIVRLAIASQGGFGQHEMDGDLVLLPLRSDLGDISRALGGILLRGKIGRAPRRLSIKSQQRRGLTGYADSGSMYRAEQRQERKPFQRRDGDSAMEAYDNVHVLQFDRTEKDA